MTYTDRFGDYTKWHALQVETGDLDPVYPVVRRLIDRLDLDADRAAWLVTLHVAYYHLGSALAALEAWPTRGAYDRTDERTLALPCGTERRGHRNLVALRKHLDYVAGVNLAAVYNARYWPALVEQIAGWFGNGRWAAYKTAEMAAKVLGAPIVATDAGHRYSSGPRKGLDLLVAESLPEDNSPATIALLDAYTAKLADDIGEPDIASVETSLCDFHSLAVGRYYLGHDIDAMQAQLRSVRSTYTDAAFEARRATLSVRYLGELNGWHGPNRAFATTYRRCGVIAVR